MASGCDGTLQGGNVDDSDGPGSIEGVADVHHRVVEREKSGESNVLNTCHDVDDSPLCGSDGLGDHGMEDGAEESEEGDTNQRPLGSWLLCGFSIGEGDLKTSNILTGGAVQLKRTCGLEIGDRVCNGRDGAEETRRDRENSCSVELVGGKGAQESAGDGAEVDGEVDDTEAVCIDLRRNGDVDIVGYRSGGQLKFESTVAPVEGKLCIVHDENLRYRAVGGRRRDCGGK